jgi:hypothetical protein
MFTGFYVSGSNREHAVQEYITVVYNNNSVALVRELTIPTEPPPQQLLGEVSANVCG